MSTDDAANVGTSTAGTANTGTAKVAVDTLSSGAKPMTVGALASILPGAVVIGDASITVDHITHDSRQARVGTLFACVPGSVVDGHDFAAQAIGNGGSALLVERVLDNDEESSERFRHVPQIVVGDARREMGVAAAALHGHPSRKLRVIGVTGTNGKTSVVGLIEQIVAHASIPVKMLGTLTGPRTTPEAPDLQATLADVAAHGGDVVAMEVSSHALALHRVAGTEFSLGVFTNLGQDHLDFHGDLQRYEQAKAELFSSRYIKTAIINTDDPAGLRIAARCDVPVRPFGLADATNLHIDGRVSTFTWEGHEIELRLPGTHNVLNALAAALVCVELGIETADIAEALRNAVAVPGRFEMVDVGQPFGVVVDYAHKPEALHAVITACRQIVGFHPDDTTGEVVVVFGCGGDRDPFKRPLMGAIAAHNADHTILTSDNPRSEDPTSILDAIEAGIDPARRHTVQRIEDRARAIAVALDTAQPGDVVLIAGKGDETQQVIGDQVLAFDDREVAIGHLLASSPGQGPS